MKRILLALLLGMAAFAALALPTVEEVQAEVAKGNVSHAEEMMRDVVQAKPGSARAHYVYAEILARNKHYAQAAEQAARAREIDPGLQFTQPEQFKAFEQLLQRERTAASRQAPPAGGDLRQPAPAGLQQPALPQPAQQSGGLPGWVWGLGLAAVAVLAWRAFGARRQAAGGGVASSAATGMGMGAGAATPGMASTGVAAAGYGPGQGYGPGPGYAPPYGAGAPGAPGAGRSWVGTGLAAAGGVAAGMLAERMLHEHSGGNGNGNGQGLTSPADAPGLHGMAPGLLGEAPLDADTQRELDQRPIDFGSGDGWGGDAGGGDGGGSSSSSDDGW